MKKIFLTVLLCFAFMLLLPSQQFSASVDDSVYRIETEPFYGRQNVESALKELKTDTGWWATYIAIGNTFDAYQVISGGFVGKSKVEDVIRQLQEETGIAASYEPIGQLVPYKQIVSRSYYGEDYVKKVVNEFTEETGFYATYQRNNVPMYKKRVLSGGFYGEEKVKEVLEDFQNITGISASYIPHGPYREGVKVLSGGFHGEEKIKEVLQDFQNETQMKATYEPIKYEKEYHLLSGGFHGEESVKQIVNQLSTEIGVIGTYFLADAQKQIYKIKFEALHGDAFTKLIQFFRQNNWWYSQIPTGRQVPVIFRIVTDELLDESHVQNALNYFRNRNWWVTKAATGNKHYEYYKIVTDGLLDSEKIKKSLTYFSERNWWATVRTTDEVGYPYYTITTDKRIDPEEIEKAASFFKNRKLWYYVDNSDSYGYNTYRIVTQKVEKEQKEKVQGFFKKNSWWAYATETVGKMYKIVTGGFIGYDKALASQKLLADRYGWSSTIVLINPQIKKTYYDLTLSEALNLQMKATPQTDKYSNHPAYISSEYLELYDGGIVVEGNVNIRTTPRVNTNDNIYKQVESGTFVVVKDHDVEGDSFNGSTKWYEILFEGQELYVHGSLVSLNGKIGRVTANGVNVRADQNVDSHIYGVVNEEKLLPILKVGSEWHQIFLGAWRNPTSSDVLFYLNPENFVHDREQRFQFLDLTKPSGVSEKVLNDYLADKGVFAGHGQTFIDAAKEQGINDLYLLSHALLETGNGHSELAVGIQYNDKTVYNMFGIGAVDSNPIEGGAKTAYENGWFSVEAAIKGGAAFIGNHYIKASQNTLYKMRWNPEAMELLGYASHQYATDIGWASKQLSSLYHLYEEIGDYVLYLDIPIYKK